MKKIKNVLICPDSFKGTLSARQASIAIDKGVKRAVPNVNTILLPMADGGLGTLDSIKLNVNGEYVNLIVKNPSGKPVNSKYLMLEDKTAIIEMAQASGLVMIPEKERNPMTATSFGTGELISDAINRGCKKIIMCLGGSATNDCGIGMCQAIGIKFLDEKHKDIIPCNEYGYSAIDLGKVENVSIEDSLAEKIGRIEFVIAGDVTNPLCGQDGASYVYGPQKGAGKEMCKELDNFLLHFSEVMEAKVGKNIRDIPGAGSAGGMGAALLAFLGAKFKSGVDIVKNIVGLDQAIISSDIVITGEGRVDYQTVYGKTISGICKSAVSHDKDVIAIAGCLGERYEEAYQLGLSLIYDSSEGNNIPWNDLVKNAENILERAGCKAMEKYLSINIGE